MVVEDNVLDSRYVLHQVICAPSNTSSYYLVDRWDHADLAILVLL